MTGSWKRLWASLLGGALIAAPAAAQQPTGTVTGQVVAQGSRGPLQEARVVVVGTNVFTSTGPDGRYALRNVPAGAQTIRVLRVGYAEQRQPVTIAAGQTATLDFVLAQTVVTLSEVVTTATGQSERRRETGASVATIGIADSTVPLAAVSNLSQTLNARAPGISVSGASGSTGTSSRIRIRGSNSISLSNDPLLVVDGVRVNANTNASNQLGVGGQAVSRLEDINPEEIESIDVLKGPAASALYGTAAANGVIQITTKKGRAGRTRWDVFGETGTLKDINNYPSNYQVFGHTPAGALTRNCNIDNQIRKLCVADSLVAHNPIELSGVLQTGNRLNGGVSATGGSQGVTYFFASELENEKGVYDVNYLHRLNVRTNARAQLTRNFDVTASIGYINSDIRRPQNDNNILGAIGGGLLGSAEDCGPSKSYPTRCFLGTDAAGNEVWDTTSRGYYSTESPQTYFAINTRNQLARTIGSLTSNWQALSWLQFNGVLGGDVGQSFDHETWPPNVSIFDLNGYRDTHRTDVRAYTANGTGTATHSFSPSLISTTSLGVQYNRDISWRIDAYGYALLAGTSSLAGTNSQFSVGERRDDNKTLGYLGREQLAWRDRVFLTGALRTDRNSAFGTNFGWIVYPAVNASWVLSEEDWFPKFDALSSLRLRSGYGVSGQRPNVLDPIIYYNPVSVNVGGADVPGFSYATNLGNTKLRPERSEEIEGGFDLGMLNNRVSLEYTHYNKNTTDALVQVPLAPSLGTSANQWQNLGRVHNWGDELGLRASVLQGGPVEFDLNANFTHQQNRLVELGKVNGVELPTIFLGFSSTQRIQKGYPLGSYFVTTYTYEDKDNNRILSRVNCPGQTATLAGGPACEVAKADTGVYVGSPFPTRELNVTPILRLGKFASIQALVDYRGGMKLFNSTAEFRCSLGTPNCQAMSDPTHVSLEDQAAAIARRAYSAYAGYIEDASFTKLREVAVTLRLPERLAARARSQGASLTLAGRNLHTWTNYKGLDPEVNALPTGNFSTADFLTQPQVRYFTARLSLSF